MKFEEGYTVGIDLGTSYSAIARLGDDGVPQMFENSLGRPITPSVILLGGDGRVVIGPPLDRVASELPDRVVVGIKREMGNRDFVKMHDGRRLTPELLSSMILTRLRQDAEKKLAPVTNAVITVPYYFNEPRRQATRHAGRIAGLNVVDIINEPTAATLAYAWQKGELGNTALPGKPRTILVYDLGGGTFDVTVVRYTPTEFGVLATDGDTMLGGLDWTDRLVDFCGEQFERTYGLDPRQDPVARKSLMVECEEAKRELSLWGKSTIVFDYRGQTLEQEIDIRKFNALTLDLLQRTLDTTEFVLSQAEVTAAELDEVLLVGGSTSMPIVAESLERICNNKPSKELNPQTAVAQGAAIHAAILQSKQSDGHGQAAEALMSRLRSITTRDVNSHSLGVEVRDPRDSAIRRNHIMIPRNTSLPSKVKQRFKTTSDNPKSLHVRLLEGETSDVSACSYIGDFRLVGLPANLPKGSPVEVSYGYNERGHIVVTLRELTGNTEARVEIAWSHGLNEASIDALATLAKSYRVE
jgi:molecular chaperone DnaK